MAAETTVKKFMNTYNITREEAVQMIEEDAAIDHGKRLDWEQSEEEERAAHARTRPKVTTKADTGKKRTVKREPDLIKRKIMTVLMDAVTAKLDDTATLENVEKTINFMQGGEKYTITITKHRPKKA